jgi:hypothetical protein
MNLVTINGKTMWMTQKMESALTQLDAARNGQFAYVLGYVATTGRIKPETYDAIFRSKVYTESIYKKIEHFIQNLRISDIDLSVFEKEVSKTELTQMALQVMRKMLVSVQKSLNDERDDAYRKAHDSNYVHSSTGIKISLQTEGIKVGTNLEGKEVILEIGEDGKPIKKDAEGKTFIKGKVKEIKRPILKDGHPVASSIMVKCIEMSRKTIVPGEYKVTNSKLETRIKNKIEKMYNKEWRIKFLSLKDDNFNELHIGGETIESDEGISIDITFDKALSLTGVSAVKV